MDRCLKEVLGVTAGRTGTEPCSEGNKPRLRGSSSHHVTGADLDLWQGATKEHMWMSTFHKENVPDAVDVCFKKTEGSEDDARLQTWDPRVWYNALGPEGQERDPGLLNARHGWTLSLLNITNSLLSSTPN